MTGSVSQADGPAAEIATLKGQVEKLSKALSYALAELHRRGYDTLRFDWKELVFLDPSVPLSLQSVCYRRAPLNSQHACSLQ